MADQQVGPTPRPWRAEGGPKEWYVAGAVRNGRPNGEIIMRSVRPPRGIPDAEYEANAQLCAAAPDLLAAAEAVVDWYKPGCAFCALLPSGDFRAGDHKSDCPAPALKAAIAAAHGEEVAGG